jgi:carbon monoxide dehydrogenase subunit G
MTWYEHWPNRVGGDSQRSRPTGQREPAVADEPKETNVQLVNEFVVPRPIDQTWAVLNDVERIAPAMPGATLTDHVDDVYHGKVKVKVGPVTAQYAGTAQFKERDEAAHHMILEATGKESSGRGRASALVNVDLTAEGAQTRVKVVTDLTISGPLAQFGRGAIAEVSSKLLGQFVTNLETMVLADEPTPTAETSTGTDTASAPATPAPTGAAGSADGGAPASPASTGAPAAGATSSTSPPAAASTPAPSSGAGAAASSGSAAPRAGAATTSVPSTPRAQPAEAPAAEVNLLKVAAWPILKRVIPVLVVVAVIVILIVWLA